MATNPLTLLCELYSSDSEDEIIHLPEPAVTGPVTPEPPVNVISRKVTSTPPFPEEYIALDYPDIEDDPVPTVNSKYTGVDLRDILNAERRSSPKNYDHHATYYPVDDTIMPVTKKFRPYIPPTIEKDAFIFVNNQDVKDCTDVFNNRYDARILRNNITAGLHDYRTINGCVIAGYMPKQVHTRWTELGFGIKSYTNKHTVEMEAGFTSHINNIITSHQYSTNPQTLVLCFTRNTAYGSETLLDIIRKGIATGWKIIIWSWSTRIDYQVRKYCSTHKKIQLNYLDNMPGVFYHERQ
jgi:hypothetical protein